MAASGGPCRTRSRSARERAASKRAFTPLVVGHWEWTGAPGSAFELTDSPRDPQTALLRLEPFHPRERIDVLVTARPPLREGQRAQLPDREPEIVVLGKDRVLVLEQAGSVLHHPLPRGLLERVAGDQLEPQVVQLLDVV